MKVAVKSARKFNLIEGKLTSTQAKVKASELSEMAFASTRFRPFASTRIRIYGIRIYAHSHLWHSHLRAFASTRFNGIRIYALQTARGELCAGSYVLR